MTDLRQRHWLGTPKWYKSEENIRKAEENRENRRVEEEMDTGIVKKLMNLF